MEEKRISKVYAIIKIAKDNIKYELVSDWVNLENKWIEEKRNEVSN
jgi:hypothetical protein